MKRKLFSLIKHTCFGRITKPFIIKKGLAKKLTFTVNPETESQKIIGLMEKEIAPYFAKLAPGVKTFIDIGASDGYYPIIVASLNEHANIIGCEPINEMKERFESNLKLNAIKAPERIKWISGFIGTKQTSLDELLKTSAGPILCKIDCEGAELDILKSGEKFLSEKASSLIIETHTLELEKLCAVFLKNLGYKTKIVKNAWWRVLIPEERPFEHNRWLIAEK